MIKPTKCSAVLGTPGGDGAPVLPLLYDFRSIFPLFLILPPPHPPLAQSLGSGPTSHRPGKPWGWMALPEVWGGLWWGPSSLQRVTRKQLSCHHCSYLSLLFLPACHVLPRLRKWQILSHSCCCRMPKSTLFTITVIQFFTISYSSL